jgi:chemosensory pili system protein ChpA (sensor histidine kinase/response regulator)
MVGLNEFGEAGWALEQVLNTWLADQGEPVPPPVRMADAEALAVAARHIAAEAPAPVPAASVATVAPVASLPLASLPNLPDLPDLSFTDEAPAPALVAPVPAAAPEGFETFAWEEPVRAVAPGALEADDDFASTDFLDFDSKQTTEPAPLLNLPSGDEFDFLAHAGKSTKPEPVSEFVSAPAAEPVSALKPEPELVEPAPEALDATLPAETSLPDFDWESEPLQPKTVEPRPSKPRKRRCLCPSKRRWPESSPRSPRSRWRPKPNLNAHKKPPHSRNPSPPLPR